MKILILSDSHERKIKLDLSKYDYILHAGDYGYSKDLLDEYNVIYVRGNCDFYGEKDKIIIIDDKRVFLTHGDLYKVKYQMLNLSLKAKEVKAKLCIYGHTHYQDIEINDDIIFLNPGAYNNGSYVEIIDGTFKFYKEDKLIKEVKDIF